MEKDQKQEKRKDLGLKAKKEEAEWFAELLQKAELISYTQVSGCYVLRPRAYAIWEQVQKYLDEKLKRDGVKNVYFPLLIPESLLKKEQQHVKGFEPEVAWVTEHGKKKFEEKLAIRPTSETIMYASYAKWIRSWRDLPLRLNQWCNVIRWEFKNPIPLIRSREFLWQEGHSCFASKEEAEKEAAKILDIYAKTYEEMYAVPVIKGRKTEREKFPGAERTLTLEVFLPSGKAAQACTVHNLGQNFAKVFNIKFRDKDEKEKYVWQNSWGLSTRSIGIAIMMHSDDKGLVLSPKVADPQIVIVPIFKEEEKTKVIEEAEKIKQELKEFRVELDTRAFTPGYKFNDWEMKGVPLRIEIGPKDLKAKQVVLARRDSGKKEVVKRNKLKKKISEVLEDIHNSLYEKAEDFLKKSIVRVSNMDKLIEAIKNKKLAKTEFCGAQECEEWIKAKTQGAKIICIVEEKPKGKCVYCNKVANHVVYIAKSY
ncbi:MAG: proline--tRNA ligase [Candidatus Pacearchaeota archaeon]